MASLNFRFTQIFQRFMVSGVSSARYNLSVVLSYTSLVGFLGHLSFIFLFAWLGIQEMTTINIGSSSVFLICFILNRRGHPYLALAIGSIEVVLHALLAVLYVGWQSGFHYYILGLVFLVFYAPTQRSLVKIFLVAGLCVIYLSLYSFCLASPPEFPLQPSHAYIVGMLNIVTTFVVLSALAHYYWLAATNAEKQLKLANSRLKHLAQTDTLTQLLNRRSILEKIELQAQDFRKSGQRFTLILADVDNFKTYNDRLGHQFGDCILVNIAELLSSHCREGDEVARWGGEEFLILLPKTSLQTGYTVAERLRTAIENRPIILDQHEVRVTVTFGVCEFGDCLDVTAVIRGADQALYEGKRGGKNSVVLAKG